MALLVFLDNLVLKVKKVIKEKLESQWKPERLSAPLDLRDSSALQDRVLPRLFRVHLDRLVPQGLLAAQETPGLDHQENQVNQDMADLDQEERRETEENLGVLCPTLGPISLDHQDHLGLQDLKETQEPKDQGDTKGRKGSPACLEEQADQEMSLDTLVMVLLGHLGLLGQRAHRAKKVMTEFQAVQESQEL